MNKVIKVFVDGKRMRDIYPHATRWQVFKYKVMMFFRKLAIVSFAAACLVVAFAAGHWTLPTTVVADVIKTVPAKEQIPPILVRISNCESPTGQFDKRGQVVVKGNKDGSVDVGMYQINEVVWGKKATELGLNLFNEQDNEKMALWLYHNRGTEDWYLSKDCWSK